jgi:putative aldouronate transport system permease protein
MIKKLSKDEIMFHLMLLPTVVVLLIYNYFPIIGGLMIAFKKYLPTQGILKSQWVGFDNFKFIFSFPDFRRALINTLSIASMKIVTELFISIMFALLLNEVGKSFVKRSLQTIVYLPHFVSWVLSRSTVCPSVDFPVKAKVVVPPEHRIFCSAVNVMLGGPVTRISFS